MGYTYRIGLSQLFHFVNSPAHHRTSSHVAFLHGVPMIPSLAVWSVKGKPLLPFSPVEKLVGFNWYTGLCGLIY